MTQPKTARGGSVSTVGFVLIILAVVGIGLAAVMVITTSIGAQSRALTALRQQAEELDFEQAALRTQVETSSSSGALAFRAAKLGMVPNPYPAFVMLGTGEVLGEPTPVTGKEFPQLRGQVPDTTVPGPQPAQTPSSTPPEPGTQDPPSDPRSDVVAADQPGADAQPSGEHE